MNKVAVAIAGILLHGLANCGLVTSQVNQRSLMNVQVGMTRDEVISIMGLPQKREAYGRTEFLIYRTGLDGSEQERFTPVAIVDGKVTGWGRNYYDNALRSKIEADVNIRQR